MDFSTASPISLHPTNFCRRIKEIPILMSITYLLCLLTSQQMAVSGFSNNSEIKKWGVWNHTCPAECISPVRNPLFKASNTAASILWAAFSSPRPYFKSMAALRTVAKGLALSCILKQENIPICKELPGDITYTEELWRNSITIF